MALGAGASGGNADACILQNVNGVLGGDTGNCHRENVGSLMGTVDYYAVQFGELPAKIVQQCFFPLDILGHGGSTVSGSGGKGKNRGGSLRSAAESVFLAAALQQSGEGLQSGGDIQSPGALGPVNLMGGNADQIGSQRFRLKGNFQKALHRIRVKNGIGAYSVALRSPLRC